MITTAPDPANPQPVPFVVPEETSASPEPSIPRGWRILGCDDILSWQPPAGLDILGEDILQLGMLTLLLGQAGLGKSTFALALAVADVRGDTMFAGIPLHPNPDRPRTWLFISNENGRKRWRKDFAAIVKSFTPEQRKVLHERIKFADIEAEVNIGVALPESMAYIKAAIVEARADVVVLDPGNQFARDEIDSKSVRQDLRWIFQAIREANKEAAILIVAHAKPGRDIVAEALTRFDGGNAQRGNRMLYGTARAVLLLVPHDESPSGDFVLSLAKCNDGPPLAPRRIRFDREAWRYSVLDGFDLDAWSESLKAKKKKEFKCPPEDVRDAVREGATTNKEVWQFLQGRPNPPQQRTVDKRVNEAIELGLVRRDAAQKLCLGDAVG